MTIRPPAAGSDYSAVDGGGNDVTALVDVVLAERDFSAATLEVRNSSREPVYLQAQLQGTPLYSDDPVTLQQADATSATFYGPGVLALDMPALSSLDEAGQMARFELARRKDPRGLVRTLETSTRMHPTHVLARTLFDRITLSETQTGHTTDSFIVAEAHHVDRGGAQHRVTWLLEPAGSETYVIIGTSTPDGTRVLAY